MRKRAVTLGLLFVTSTCLFGACIENDQSLTIVGAVAPDDDCTWQIDPDTWWARGTLDLGFWGANGNPTYVIFPQIHNNMPFNGDPLNHQLDTMAVVVEKATVTYEWLYGREEIERGHAELLLLEDAEETIYLAGTVDSGSESGDDPGKMVTGLEAIPHQLGGQLAGLGQDADGLVLGLGVTIHGTTLGGTEVTTNKFIFPVYLCWGCLADRLGNYECCDQQPDAYFPGCIPGQDAVTLPCVCEAL